MSPRPKGRSMGWRFTRGLNGLPDAEAEAASLAVRVPAGERERRRAALRHQRLVHDAFAAIEVAAWVEAARVRHPPPSGGGATHARASSCGSAPPPGCRCAGRLGIRLCNRCGRWRGLGARLRLSGGHSLVSGAPSSLAVAARCGASCTSPAWVTPRRLYEPMRIPAGCECKRCGRRQATGRPGRQRCPVPQVWEDGRRCSQAAAVGWASRFSGGFPARISAAGVA